MSSAMNSNVKVERRENILCSTIRRNGSTIVPLKSPWRSISLDLGHSDRLHLWMLSPGGTEMNVE